MRSSVLLMTGLAFTFGLIIGLLLQLPGVSSPLRSLQNIRVKRDVVHLTRDDEGTTAVYDGDQLRTIDNHQNNSGDLLSSGITNAVEKLHTDIQQIYDSIEAIKSSNKHPEDDLGIPPAPVSVSVTLNLGHHPQENDGSDTPESTIVEHPLSDISSVISDNIYWSDSMEDLYPKGFTAANVSTWRQLIQEKNITDIREGCGRMQNRIIHYEDGSKACARYRINVDQIQGEVYSFYLAQGLGIHNLPPPVLAYADPKQSQWSTVQPQINSAEWSSERVVVMTPWLEDLSSVYIPRELRSADGVLAGTNDILVDRTANDMVALMQWSDLVIFDYLTANLDRVVNNMYNQQWNDQMMNSPTHNLLSIPQMESQVGDSDSSSKRSKGQDLLVFLDNESGLFHGYRLLDKYAPYHTSLLDSVCIFRKSTVEAVRRLHEDGDVVKELMEIYREHEPLHNGLPQLPTNTANVLRTRLRDVYTHIEKCQARYNPL